jgi:hypothetical protein
MAQPVLGASATNTQIDDDTQNPTDAVSTTGRRVVHVTLVFDGVDFNPDALYDALDAGYATVGYEKNVAARGTYIFNIAA